MRVAPPAVKSGSRLLVRREQPRQDIEEDHHRAGEQGECDQAEPDDGGIDTAVIGETGGDAHDFRVAAVDEETSVHFEFPLLAWLQAIGSEVAAETSRSAERNAPAKIVAVSRMEAMLNMVITPLALFGTDHRARAFINAGVVPIGKSDCFSMHGYAGGWLRAEICAANW
jgi:hypothetical protein